MAYKRPMAQRLISFLGLHIFSRENKPFKLLFQASIREVCMYTKGLSLDTFLFVSKICAEIDPPKKTLYSNL